MEQAMTDDRIRKVLAAQSRYALAISRRCDRLIWALDAFKRGENTSGWECLFMAEGFSDEAEAAQLEGERA
jgi:hypothetical protein